MAVTVLGPGFFVLARIDRSFLAIGDGVDPARLDAMRDEVVLHRIGATDAGGGGGLWAQAAMEIVAPVISASLVMCLIFKVTRLFSSN